jgi:gluconate 2-dehydrogenase gamma chain
MADESIPRRQFLVNAGVAGASLAGSAATSSLVPAAAEAQTAAPAPAPSNPALSATLPQSPLQYLNDAQHDFVVAAVDTLIPADELSPSGGECGCANYIDRQLASAWGGGAKMYRAGPYFKGKPEQGYQLPLTPAEFFVAGIAAANEWTRKAYGRDFQALDQGQRIEALKAMQEGKAEFDNFSSRAFFARLLAMTMEGFFADPIYGGNRDMVSWRMLGYPGLPATYAKLVDEYRDKRYIAEPQSIADFS